MATRTPANPEKLVTVLAHWPTKATPNDRLGCGADYGSTSGSDSFWISLRAVRPSNLRDMGGQRADDVRHIGLYLWLMPMFERRVRFLIEPRVHDLYSADAAQMGRLTTTLRAMTKRLYYVDPPISTLSGFKAHLGNVLRALGLSRAVQYGPDRLDSLAPASAVVEDIVAEFERRLARCGR
jgi:hypothetical protein